MRVSGPFPYHFVHGDRFSEIADFTFWTRGRKPWTSQELERALASQEWGTVIVFAATHDVNGFFDLIKGASIPKIILVSHNSDGRVRYSQFREGDADASRTPESVVHWFAQNVEVSCARLECLPIGLERPCIDPRAKKFSLLKRMMQEQVGPRSNRVYVNHVVATNPAERQPAFDAFSDKSFALCQNGGLTYEQYLRQVRASEFCVSPPGNGPDCHRTWECLYLGVIPIVKRSFLSESLYSDLPVLQIADYREVNEKVLDEFLSRWKGRRLDDKRLAIESYWEKIQKTALSMDRSRHWNVEKPGLIRRLKLAFEN